MIEARDLVELLFRGTAVGVFVAIAAGLLREPRAPARLTGALFCLGAAGHAVTQSPFMTHALGFAIAPAWALSVIAGGLFWAFAMELFGDNEGLRPARFLPAAALLVVGLIAISVPPSLSRYVWLAQNLINAGLMIHILIVTWTGLRDDLVEPRRRLRGPMIAAAAVYALAISGVQSTEIFSRPATELSPLAALLLLTLALGGFLVFFRADERLFGRASRATTQASAGVVPLEDRATLERLRKALDEDEIWRREDLTIGGLAAIVGVPEHRLRKIINEGLGYRNFAAFLGERRVHAAKDALANPETARRNVSAIAFDVGFSSLASFNRVFREIAGVTPTAFRKAALAAPNPEIAPQD